MKKEYYKIYVNIVKLLGFATINTLFRYLVFFLYYLIFSSIPTGSGEYSGWGLAILFFYSLPIAALIFIPTIEFFVLKRYYKLYNSSSWVLNAIIFCSLDIVTFFFLQKMYVEWNLFTFEQIFLVCDLVILLIISFLLKRKYYKQELQTQHSEPSILHQKNVNKYVGLGFGAIFLVITIVVLYFTKLGFSSSTPFSSLTGDIQLEQSALTSWLVPDANAFLIQHLDKLEAHSIQPKEYIVKSLISKIDGARSFEYTITNDIHEFNLTYDNDLNPYSNPEVLMSTKNHEIFGDEPALDFKIDHYGDRDDYYELDFYPRFSKVIEDYLIKIKDDKATVNSIKSWLPKPESLGGTNFTNLTLSQLRDLKLDGIVTISELEVNTEIGQIIHLLDSNALFTKLKPKSEYTTRSTSYNTTYISTITTLDGFGVQDLQDAGVYVIPPNLSDGAKEYLKTIKFNYLRFIDIYPKDGQLYRMNFNWEVVGGKYPITIEDKVVFHNYGY